MRPIATALAVAALAVVRIGTAEAKGPPPPIFLVAVLDGLRPDHLGCYGYRGHTSPMIDRLCASGVVFTHAYAQSSWAPASVASLLTSRYPSGHGVRAGSDGLSTDQPTLAAQLQAAGYVTVAYTPNVDQQRGFARGFREFNAVPSLSRAPGEGGQASTSDDVVMPVLVWLERHPWELAWYGVLLYVRYDGANLGHVASPDYLRRFMTPPIDPSRLIDIGHRLGALQIRFPADEIRDLPPAYDAAVAELDASLEAILDLLRKPTVVSRLWVILLGPFGESLGEHGVVGHGSALYDEQIHVPLVIVPPPGHRTGFRYDGIVQLIDVAPTLVDLAGAPPDRGFEGRSLRPVLEGGSLPGTEAIAELLPPDASRLHARAVVGPDSRKRIERSGQGEEQYDLRVDPGETRNLHD